MRRVFARLLGLGLELLRAPMRLIAVVSRLIFFPLLYTFAHLLYSCYVVLSRLWETRHQLLTPRRSVAEQLIFLRRYGTKLKKRPQHIAFVIEDRAQANDLNEYVKVVLWCLALDTPYVTLYDARGTLKSKEQDLLHLVEEKRRFFTASGSLPRPPASSPAPSFVLSVQSAADGRAKLVEVAQAFARTLPGGPKRRDLTVQDVDAMLPNVPETDLLLQCGGSAVGSGYQPWQMRVTEIFFSPSTVKTLAVEEMLRVLQLYSGCTQRYGT